MAKVDRAIRVAVLDDTTCDFCDDADSAVVEVGSAEYEDLKPPNGCEGDGMCRCIYAYIRIDEPIKPILTPKNKLPIVKSPFVRQPVTPAEIKIEDEFVERLGLTPNETKAIVSIERQSFGTKNLRKYLREKDSVIIRLRNGKEIIIYDRKLGTALKPAQQEFVRDVINYYDKGLGNLDKMNRIIIDGRKQGGIFGGFYSDPSKTTAVYMTNIIGEPAFTSTAGTLYHEGTHAWFYDRYITVHSLRNQKAREILDKVKKISPGWEKKVETSLRNLAVQPAYGGTYPEELVARYVGMIKHKDINGTYLRIDLKDWGRPDKDLRKILTKEGLL